MALLTPAGVKHARGLTRWADLDHVTIAWDDWSRSVSLLFEADDLEEAFTPAMHRTDELLRLVRQNVPAEKITEESTGLARKPLDVPVWPAATVGSPWFAAERALARFYCFLREPEDTGTALSLLCLGLIFIAMLLDKTEFVPPLMGLAIFLNPRSRGSYTAKIVPTPNDKKRAGREDRISAQSRRLAYVHSDVGWWMWGHLLATGVPLMLFWPLLFWLPLFEAGPLPFILGFLFWTGLWLGASDVRLVVEGGARDLSIAVKVLGQTVWWRALPYETIASVRLVDRPPKYMLGMLWISRSSAWNLTPAQVPSIETTDGQRYLVATDEPDALSVFLGSRIGQKG